MKRLEGGKKSSSISAACISMKIAAWRNSAGKSENKDAEIREKTAHGKALGSGIKQAYHIISTACRTNIAKKKKNSIIMLVAKIRTWNGGIMVKTVGGKHGEGGRTARAPRIINVNSRKTRNEKPEGNENVWLIVNNKTIWRTRIALIQHLQTKASKQNRRRRERKWMTAQRKANSHETYRHIKAKKKQRLYSGTLWRKKKDAERTSATGEKDESRQAKAEHGG